MQIYRGTCDTKDSLVDIALNIVVRIKAEKMFLSSTNEVNKFKNPEKVVLLLLFRYEIIKYMFTYYSQAKVKQIFFR